MCRGLGLVVAALCVPSLCHAAFIGIDDSDPATMSVTWSGFNGGGFSVDGSAFTADGTMVVADAFHSYSGTWLTSGSPAAEVFVILFALPGDPTDVTSGIGGSYTSVGIINGTFGGFTGVPYFSTGSPNLPQNGGAPFVVSIAGISPSLGVSFRSENPLLPPPPPPSVPEPASLTLVVLGALGWTVGAIRRRRRA